MSYNPLDAARDEGFTAGVTSIHSETLRDRFAVATLVGLLASRDAALTIKETAALSFEIADAMMEARK